MVPCFPNSHLVHVHLCILRLWWWLPGSLWRPEGGIMQFVMMPTCKCSHDPLLWSTVADLDQCSDGLWCMEVDEEFPEENWAKLVKSQKITWRSCSFVLELVPNHASILQASREPWNSCFLCRCINILVSFQVSGDPLCHYTEIDFPLTFRSQIFHIGLLHPLSFRFRTWLTLHRTLGMTCSCQTILMISQRKHTTSEHLLAQLL